MFALWAPTSANGGVAGLRVNVLPQVASLLDKDFVAEVGDN